MKEYLLPVGLILLGVAIFLLWRAAPIPGAARPMSSRMLF